MRYHLKRIVFNAFSPIVHTKKNIWKRWWKESISRFVRHRFHLSTEETECFQNNAFCGDSTFETIFKRAF